MAAAASSVSFSIEQALEIIHALPDTLPADEVGKRADHLQGVVQKFTSSGADEPGIRALKMMADHFALLNECFSQKTIAAAPAHTVSIHPLFKKIAVAIAHGGVETLNEKLGQGTCGDVYLAKIGGSEYTFAVKQIAASPSKSASLEKRMQNAFNEIAMSYSLPDAVGLPILYGRKTDEEITLAYPIASGDLFGRYFENPLKFSIEEFKKDFLLIVDQLQTFHNLGVVHGDVKPDNVMYLGDEPRLADFDQARLKGQWRTGGGTEPYWCPGYVEAREIDFKADIWAIGVTLFGGISGAFPFSEEFIKSPEFKVPEKVAEALNLSCIRYAERMKSRDPDGSGRALVEAIFKGECTLSEIAESPFFKGIEKPSASSGERPSSNVKKIAPLASEALSEGTQKIIGLFASFMKGFA